MAKNINYDNAFGSIIPDLGGREKPQETPSETKTAYKPTGKVTSGTLKKGRPRKDEEREVLFSDARKFTVTASDEQIKKLSFIAQSKGMTIKELNYRIYKDYLDKYERKNGEISLSESKNSAQSIY